MSLGHTKIPYLGRLWHPTTGCSRGCPGCWARSLVCTRLAGKMKGLPAAEDGDPFSPAFHRGRLADPLRARKPQVIGVSFFGDLFDHWISDEQIAAVFGVMAASPQHTFIVLTKQAERMAQWFSHFSDGCDGGDGPQRSRSYFAARSAMPGQAERDLFDVAYKAAEAARMEEHPECIRWHEEDDKGLRIGFRIEKPPWPLPNVWVGVSATNQADADERIPHLLRTPAAHRWVSVEPMVGPIDLHKAAWNEGGPLYPLDIQARMVIPRGEDGWFSRGFDGVRALDLVICGGQSGPGAVPLHPDWARSLRDQCASAGVPFYFKQRSGMHPEPEPELDGVRHTALPWRKPASGTHGPTREEYRWGWKP